MANLSPPFIPPWAVPCWCDDVAVYVALPMKDGGHFIQSYPLTENGFSKALNNLRLVLGGVKKSNGGSAIIFDHLVANAPVKHVAKGSKKTYTAEERKAATQLLKKVGIMK